MPFFEKAIRARTPRQKRAILITGSTGGIGSCCAKTLHSEDFRVFVARNPAAVETLQREVPERVVGAIVRALTSNRPKTRYLVG